MRKKKAQKKTAVATYEFDEMDRHYASLRIDNGVTTHYEARAYDPDDLLDTTLTTARPHEWSQTSWVTPTENNAGVINATADAIRNAMDTVLTGQLGDEVGTGNVVLSPLNNTWNQLSSNIFEQPSLSDRIRQDAIARTTSEMAEMQRRTRSIISEELSQQAIADTALSREAYARALGSQQARSLDQEYTTIGRLGLTDTVRTENLENGSSISWVEDPAQHQYAPRPRTERDAPRGMGMRPMAFGPCDSKAAVVHQVGNYCREHGIDVRWEFKKGD